jgi:hypothetical protein
MFCSMVPGYLFRDLLSDLVGFVAQDYIASLSFPVRLHLLLYSFC